MNFVIEKSIPLPPGRNNRKYPFAFMQVGDSILFTKEVGDCAQAAAHAHGTKNNKKFRCRSVPEGFRIWRAA